MSQNYQVKQIISYLTKKKESLQKQLSEFESPITQEMAKKGTHLQYEYVRLKSQLESYEDALLAIETFTNEEGAKKTKGR